MIPILIFHIRISFLIQLALAVYYLLFSFQSTTENLLDFLSIYSDLHHFRECQNILFGGLKRTRTSLCLYSYKVRALSVSILIFGNLVGSRGLEPPTSRLSGVRSNHLSYEPIVGL